MTGPPPSRSANATSLRNLSRPLALGDRASAPWASLLLLACVAMGFGQACQGPFQTTRIVCGACEEPDRFVRLQLRRTAPQQHPPPPFAHPLALSPEDWTPILTSIRVQGHRPGLLFSSDKDPVEPAFSPNDIAYLSGTLSKAFAQARPGEWIVFGLSHASSASAAVTEVTSGGWFVDGPHLHLILAHYRYTVTMPNVRELLWQAPLHANTEPLYDFVPGDFQTVAQTPNLLSRLLLPNLPAIAIAYQPLLLATTAPPQPSPKSSAAPPSRPDQQSDAGPSLEERLQKLKRLREQALITEEEYRAKKQQLLEQF